MKTSTKPHNCDLLIGGKEEPFICGANESYRFSAHDRLCDKFSKIEYFDAPSSRTRIGGSMKKPTPQKPKSQARFVTIQAGFTVWLSPFEADKAEAAKAAAAKAAAAKAAS